MRKHWIIALITALSSVALLAQQTRSDAGEKTIIYKWSEGGITHYSTVPPRKDPTTVTKLDHRGFIISEGKEPSGRTTIVSPIRPQTASMAEKKSEKKEALPKGAISREQRCQDAKNNLNILEEKQHPTREDENGNLIPLTPEEIQQAQKATQETIKRLCQ